MESNREEARTSGVLSSLRRTWIALALAVATVLPVGCWTGLGVFAEVFPLCRGSLEDQGQAAVDSIGDSWGELAQVPLDEQTPGFARLALRYDHDTGGHDAYRDLRLVRLDCGAPGEPEAECGRIPFGWSGRGRVGRVPSVEVRYDPAHDWYVVVDTSHVLAPPYPVAVFRATSSPVRHFQRDRLFAGRHVPALVAFLALGALAVAALRSRRAIAYASRLHAWTESTLTREGMVQDEGGVTLATVESGTARRVPAGPVLVDPAAFAKGSVYRELPIVDRRQVAPGSHARWREGTFVRLRDARVLSVVSVACSAVALGARLLGG